MDISEIYAGHKNFIGTVLFSDKLKYPARDKKAVNRDKKAIKLRQYK